MKIKARNKKEKKIKKEEEEEEEKTMWCANKPKDKIFVSQG